MSVVVVPRDVTTTDANVLVAGTPSDLENQQVVLRANGTDHPIATWEQTRGIAHHVLSVKGLSPGTRYALELTIDGAPSTTAWVTTLPTRLPGPGEKPFTMLLGSCFCRRQDQHGAVEAAYKALATDDGPSIHLWGGDQVYLDSPWFRFSVPHRAASLESLFRENYELTWSTQHGSGSLGGILSRASNYFTSDDHEFWNNAPNRATYVVNSFTADGRKTWLELATDFYRVFQTPKDKDVLELRVGNVALLMADTRIHRDADEKRFMRDPDLTRVCDWLGALAGPGFLVLGQPVFEERAGIGGHFFDWGLPDYEQYARLVRALATVTHSVVVLTGDVHFGRIARCSLGTGGELIEIISSPLALVDPTVRGKWKPAPSPFPNQAIPGVVQSTVDTESFQSADPHFLTLELNAHGTAVDLVVRYWPIGSSNEPPGRRIYQHRLR